MKCQLCNINEAQIVFTQIVNNEKMVLHICTDCARTKGLSVEIKHTSEPETPPASFLAGFNEGEKQSENAQEEEVPDLVCDSCGMAFSEFKEKGLFGCDSCHEAFIEHVRRLFKQIHGTEVHTEKVAQSIKRAPSLRHQIKDLKTQLSDSVEHENYELAAEIRDRISSLEKEREET
jgi:protein arginine kinase activator